MTITPKEARHSLGLGPHHPPEEDRDMASFAHIPRPIVATFLRHARDMRDARQNQQPNQWLDARYRAAADLADALRVHHNIHADTWARDLIFRVAT